MKGLLALSVGLAIAAIYDDARMVLVLTFIGVPMALAYAVERALRR